MVSKGEVDRAGATMRTWWQTPKSDFPHAAANTVWEYRRQFSYPMTKVNANLRYYIRQASCEVLIAQRLKRLPRIVEKMCRHPRMRLSQMQDVGGCRAILPDQESVEQVLQGLTRNWTVTAIDDYVTSPRPTGYRAIHVIVKKDDVPVELQLRTTGQQDWADEVERIDSLTGCGLKDGDGPADIVRYAQLLSEIINLAEREAPVDQVLLDEFRVLRQQVPR